MATHLRLCRTRVTSTHSPPNGGSSDTGGDDNTGVGTVSGKTISFDAADFGLSDATDLSGKTLTLSDGTTLSFVNNGGNTTPKYYNTGTCFRMYPKNSLTITASKTISSVALVCDNYNGTIYNASGDITSTPGSVNTNGENVTITSISSKSAVITDASTTTGASSQLRIKTITITYAE